MIAYLGYPINFPDQKPFGTICVLDNKERQFCAENEQLLLQFKKVIELDLALIFSLGLKEKYSHTDIIQRLSYEKEELLKAQQKAKESEQTYRNLFQNAQVGLFRTRISDGKILESNRQLAVMFGYDDPDEFIAEYKTSGNYVDKGTREKILEMIKENGFVQNFEARFYRKDKSIFWARYSARIYPDKGWIEGVAEDITEQKISEEALKKEKTWSENIVNNAPNIIVGLGERSKIFVFNKYAEKLTGYKAEEVIGKEWIGIFIPDELKETIYQVWDEIVENKLIDHHFENEIITKSGDRRLIEWSNTILTEDGEFRMILSFGVDITERKQAEEAIEKASREWQKTFDSTNDVIWLLDKDQKVLRANQTTQQIFPRLNSKLVDMHCWEIVHQTSEPIPGCPFLRAKRSKRRETMDFKIEESWFSITVDPIFDETDEFIGAVHILTDITERKQAEEELRKLKDDLEIQVAEKTKELKERVKELERYHDATVNREFRIKELRDEIARLKEINKKDEF